MMKKLLSVLLVCIITGCSSTQVAEEHENWEQVIADRNPEPAMINNYGSLYNDSYMFTLYEDKRAYRVGDILTVVLDERTQSSKSADSSMDRSSSVNVPVPLIGNLNTSEVNMRLGATQSFDGESSASQQNFLRGSITVKVTDVLPNGALMIQGEKWIKLNQGDEYLKLQGLVRPEDIDVTNRVSSQRVADARISYSGKGTLAQNTRPGWLTRVFTFLNPF